MVENYQDRKKVLIVCLGYVFRQSQYKLKKKKCYGRGDGVKKKKKLLSTADKYMTQAPHYPLVYSVIN